jgi:predicted transcriptional regulator
MKMTNVRVEQSTCALTRAPKNPCATRALTRALAPQRPGTPRFLPIKSTCAPYPCAVHAQAPHGGYTPPVQAVHPCAHTEPTVEPRNGTFGRSDHVMTELPETASTVAPSNRWPATISDIRAAREHLGWNQKELGARVATSQNAISKLETGRGARFNDNLAQRVIEVLREAVEREVETVVPKTSEASTFWPATIGDIRAARLKLDLRQQDLADLANTSRTTIAKLETGHPINGETLERVLEVLRQAVEREDAT